MSYFLEARSGAAFIVLVIQQSVCGSAGGFCYASARSHRLALSYILVARPVISVSNFQLSQKEFITLGVVALERKILSTKLAQKLQLHHEDRMRAWISGLIEKFVIVSRGVKKGTEYLLNPELFAHAKLGTRASLKTLDPHKLEALIEEDLKYNGISKMTDIQARFDGVPMEDIRKAVYKMATEGRLGKLGADRNRSYMLAKKSK